MLATIRVKRSTRGQMFGSEWLGVVFDAARSRNSCFTMPAAYLIHLALGGRRLAAPAVAKHVDKLPDPESRTAEMGRHGEPT
jgi:hypothetical protein